MEDFLSNLGSVACAKRAFINQLEVDHPEADWLTLSDFTIPQESVNKTVEADREVAEQLIDELKNRQLAMITDFNPSQMKIFIAAQRHHLAAIKKGTMPYTSFLWRKKKTGKKIGVQVHSVGRRSKKNGSRTRRAAGRPTQPKVHNFSQNLC